MRDDSGRDHPGSLTGQDLAGRRPTYEPPVTVDRHGWTLATAGPRSQGPALLRALTMLDDVEGTGLRDRSASAVLDADVIHVGVEALQHLAARRATPPVERAAGREAAAG